MDNQLQNYQESQDIAPELTLQDMIRIVNRGRSWIFWIIVIVLVFTIYYTSSVTPEYKATSTVLIKTQNDMSTFFDFSGMQGQTEIINEIELIKSRVVAEKAVEQLWNSEHKNNLNLFSSRLFYPPGQDFRNLLKEIFSLGLYDPTTIVSTVYGNELTELLRFTFARRLQSRIEVNNKRNTDILKITYTSPFPDESALITNTITHAYLGLDKQWNSDQVYNLLEFLEGQVLDKESELAKAEESVRDYKEKEQIFDLSGNTGKLLEQLVEAEAQYYNTIAEINISKEKIHYIREQLSKEEQSLADQLLNSINARVFALRQEIGIKEAELVRNSGLYGEDHEAVIAVKNEIDYLKNNLDKQTTQLIARGVAVADPIEYRQKLISELLTAEAMFAGKSVRSDEYDKLVNRYNKQLNQLPKKQLQLARLERDRSVLAETYIFMRHKLEETKITVASESGKVQIVDMAIVSNNRSKPNHSKNLLLGLILGLGLGVGLILLIEFLDNTVKSLDWIERLGLSVLGVIPVVGGEAYQKKGNRRKGVIGGNSSHTQRMRRRMITREDPKSPISEAYRSLRTNIIYTQADKPIKSILVSSPGAGEGKTTTVTNLAITFANMGKRTLLIDADLRRPVQHSIWKKKKDRGLTHYLSGATDDFKSFVQSTDVDNLSIVTAGVSPPNPSELLGSNRMTELIANLEKEWDYILFDSPPIAAVTDASMVSKEIDTMVLVVKAGETHKDAYRRSLHTLNSINVPLAGVVMNGISRQTSYDTYYYYYYQYYTHYYGSGEEVDDGKS